MFNLKRIGLLLLLFFVSVYASAQTAAAANGTKDFMRSNEKVYVVMAVVLIILLGLFVYVFRLDRKITRLEKGEV